MMSNKNNQVNIEPEVYQIDDQKKQEILSVLKKEVRKKYNTEKRKSFILPTLGLMSFLLLLFLLFNEPVQSLIGNVGFNSPNANNILEGPIPDNSKKVVEDFLTIKMLPSNPKMNCWIWESNK